MGMAAILGHVPQIPQTNFSSLAPWKCNLFFGQVVFVKMFENIGYIHAFSTGVGADNTLGSESLYKK